jgi:hypothetical protein
MVKLVFMAQGTNATTSKSYCLFFAGTYSQSETSNDEAPAGRPVPERFCIWSIHSKQDIHLLGNGQVPQYDKFLSGSYGNART